MKRYDPDLTSCFKELTVQELYNTGKNLLNYLGLEIPEYPTNEIEFYTLHSEKRGVRCISPICYRMRGMPRGLGEIIENELPINEEYIEDIRYVILNAIDHSPILTLKLVNGISITMGHYDIILRKNEFIQDSLPGIMTILESDGKTQIDFTCKPEEERTNLEEFINVFSGLDWKLKELNQEKTGRYFVKIEVNTHQRNGTEIETGYISPWSTFNKKDETKVNNVLYNLERLQSEAQDDYKKLIDRYNHL